MNRVAVFYALAYSVFFITAKLLIVLGGYSLTRFGYLYSHITLTFLVIPFYIPPIRKTRRMNGGFISGKECMRIALTVFGISALIISVYNYFEYEYSGKYLAVEYYNGQQFLDFLKSQVKFKPEQYQGIIDEQIKAAEGAGFKATTGKLFSMMLIGFSSAFVVSLLMKRSVRTS
jgi:hypothetical protein